MAEEYIEIKDISDKDKKKDAKKGKSSKKEEQADYTWLWVVLILAVIGVVIVVLLTQPTTTNYADDQGTGDVAALVNGDEIYASEVDEIYNSFPEFYQQVYTKELLLDQLINERLILQEATTQGYDVSQEELDEAIAELELQLPENVTMEKAVAEQNMTLDRFYSLLEEGILKQKLIDDEITSQIDVTDEEKLAYFDQADTENLSYEDVADQIEQILASEQQTTLLEAYIQELRDKADITILMYTNESDEAVESQVEPVPAGETVPSPVEESEELTEPVDEAMMEEEKPVDEVEEELMEAPVDTVTDEELEEGLYTDLDASCVSDFDVSDDAVIFYYSDDCPYCASMATIVQTLEGEGYTFYWVNYANEDETAVLDECFEIENLVPQFICAGTGETKVGTLRENSLREFAENCA